MPGARPKIAKAQREVDAAWDAVDNRTRDTSRAAFIASQIVALSVALGASIGTRVAAAFGAGGIVLAAILYAMSVRRVEKARSEYKKSLQLLSRAIIDDIDQGVADELPSKDERI